MTATLQKSTTPLLDGRHRGWVTAAVFIVLCAMTIDGLVTWLEARDADEVIAIVGDDVAGGVDDRGLLLDASHRAEVAANTNGDRLDRDWVNEKMVLAAVAVITAAGLVLWSKPGSSRNVMAMCILVAAAAFFAPLFLHADTIDIVTTAHGG
jgi:hypothetical protein